MAARCTTPPVAMHHSSGNDAPSSAVRLHCWGGVRSFDAVVLPIPLYLGKVNLPFPLFCHILHTPFIRPELIEQLKICLTLRCIQLLDHAEHITTPLTAQISASKAIDRSICYKVLIIDSKKSRHDFICTVGLELRFAAHPISTFFGNCFLCKFVSLTDLKFTFTIIQRFLSYFTRNIEFPFSF